MCIVARDRDFVTIAVYTDQHIYIFPYLFSPQRYSQHVPDIPSIVDRLQVRVHDNLLCEKRHKAAVREALDDGNVVVLVHLLLNLANVADGEAVEDVHEDDDEEKDKHCPDDVAEPVVEHNVRVVHLAHKHDCRLDEGEEDGAEGLVVDSWGLLGRSGRSGCWSGRRRDSPWR